MINELAPADFIWSVKVAAGYEVKLSLALKPADYA